MGNCTSSVINKTISDLKTRLDAQYDRIMEDGQVTAGEIFDLLTELWPRYERFDKSSQKKIKQVNRAYFEGVGKDLEPPKLIRQAGVYRNEPVTFDIPREPARVISEEEKVD